TGTAMFTILAGTGTNPAINGEVRITNLMLDGSKLTTGTASGIHAAGNVQNVVMRDVCIRKMPGNGIVATTEVAGVLPYSWRLHSVMTDNCKGDGYSFDRHTDLTMNDCQAIGNGGSGFKLINCANSTLSICRAEWNAAYGFWLTGAWGNWPGSGSGTMNACSTDRNAWDGVRVDATGNGAFLINALMTRRDGRNNGPGGGKYAGLALLNQAPVVVTGVT
ncbi:right-handed parallel beta-helix repeat-containing protein, partial [Streptomyces sp. 039-1]|uniref:right-handed parallel beta-helix repeat-containing protein n=1 Tax=Streptomyces sp. 039-1 TaxID=2789263 RepID=UPI0039F5E5DC